jgi:HAD superfamily hydrolase (TIGR01509 family)
MNRIRAVLLDWSGTLVEYPKPSRTIRQAFEALGRPATNQEVELMVNRLDQASQLPELRELWGTEDRSADSHQQVHRFWFRAAGLDPELAEALYKAQCDVSNYRLYPDTEHLLSSLDARRVRVAVVSDIHFDIREHFAAAGLSEYIDVFVLSFEHGYQKPDTRMFTTALAALDTEAHHALMVGDWYRSDGAAATAGITTLILPKPPDFGPRGLETVIHLIDNNHHQHT